MANSVKIAVIQADGLPKIGLCKRKYDVEVNIGENVKKTAAIARRGDVASWNEAFQFETDSSSVLEIRVYAHRRKAKVYVGGMNEHIGALLAKGTTEGVTRKLSKYDATGALIELQTVVVFSIEVTSASSTNGEEGRMDGPVEREVSAAREASPALNGMGRIVGDATGAVNLMVGDADGIASVVSIWEPFLNKIQIFTRIVDHISEVHPYAKMAWMVLGAAYKVVLIQKNRDAGIMSLVGTMSDAFDFVQEADILKEIDSHKRILELIAQQTVECAHFIRDYAKNKNFWMRTFKLAISDVDKRIRMYEAKFMELQSAFQTAAILQIDIAVQHTLNDLEILATEVDLNDMPYAEGARFLSEKACLPDTRETLIREISDWANSDSEGVPRIFFLSGLAGSGKSSIAHTVAKRFNELQRLGSCFFFDQAKQAMRPLDTVFSTIARDLADLDPQRKRSLWQVIKGSRSLRTTRAVQEQFDNFILKPAASLAAIGPIVIVIDALDESGDNMSRKGLLSILAGKAAQLPSNFRFLVTARAERDIQEAFSGKAHIYCKGMDSVDMASTLHDITLFVHHELGSLEQQLPRGSWQSLVDKSEGHFQWAFTACQFIKGDGKYGWEPVEQLQLILSSDRHNTPEVHLDKLYLHILHQTFPMDKPGFMERFKLMMGIVLAAKEPLSMLALRELFQQQGSAELVKLILSPMGSLLSGVTQESVPVRPLHTSFGDFLTDPKRSGNCYVDLSLYHEGLVLACLQVMKANLHFNICKLETSHILNKDVPNLKECVQGAIPSHLSYACSYWADHLSGTTFTHQIAVEVEDFFHNWLLFWLEALSLIEAVNIATGILSSVIDWNKGDNSITIFAKDAQKFVAAFGNVISQSAPHVYLSALPWAPVTSKISQQYLPRFPNVFHIEFGDNTSWPAIQNIMEGHTNFVSSVAYSPDGEHIVSGSYDRTIRVWNTKTGIVVSGPFEGHTHYLNAVAFSPDGKQVVSGSWDKTIRVWDTTTGNIVAGPFEGHIDCVTSVAFSPDGNHIVSGSDDCSVRVWDPKTGNIVAGPFEGHTSLVNSVAYSPDGKYIVSGSDDETIQVWDAKTGNIISGPFEGHTNSVRSVAFTPNGKHIVSGSYDKTIQIWDVETGNAVTPPFKGHTKSIRAIAVSSDGKHIVSGSDDLTIRVWDAQTGTVVSGPFEGHTGWIKSVAFSPDNKHVVSGSDDFTLRVWDTETGNVISGLYDGHTKPVRAVAFSPDGKHIVSGSDDNTVQLWDIATGNLVVPPFEGHTDSVRSVAFSPDGKYIASGSYDKTILVWDKVTGNVISGPFEGHTHYIESVAFSPDSKWVVSGSNDKTIRVWDIETGNIILEPFEGHTDYVKSVAFSPDGRYVVSGSDDKTIRVWDVSTGTTILEPLEDHSDYINSVAFSPNGKFIASGSDDCTIRVWDAVTGAVISEPLKGHTQYVESVSFSPDSKYIVSGSDDCTIQVWDIETGKVVLGPFQGHTGWINSVSFSPDGKHTVSGSEDHTIRVWDIDVDHFKDHNDKVLSSASNGFKNTSQLQNGWILNSSIELVFWVPGWAREGLWWPANTAVIANRSTTKLDLSHFAHGTVWQECYKPM